VLTFNDVSVILAELTYKSWKFLAKERSDERGFVLRVSFIDADGNKQNGRPWLVSPDATRSEVVQTALKAVLTAEEHEAREQFFYQGSAIFGPHLDVDALLRVADELDVREVA
jgi:hypothetical protein